MEVANCLANPITTTNHSQQTSQGPPPPTVWPWKIQRTPVWRARACQWWSHHQLQNLNALWYDEAYVVWPMSKAVPKLHQPKLCEICYGENLSLAKKSSYGYLWYQITQFCQVWKSQTLKKHIQPLITPSFTKVFLQGHSRSWSVSQTSFPEGKKNTNNNNCLLESNTIKQRLKNHDFSRHEFAHNAYICLPHHIVKPFSKLLLINLKRLSTLTTFQWLHAKSLNGIIESLGECCMISEQA